MEKSNIVLFVSGVIVLLICGGLYFADTKMAFGVLAGYFTGLINLFMITSQVKKMLGQAGSTVAKVTAGSFFYLLRLSGAAAIIAVVVINKKYFSILGFLAGFTFCIVAIIASHIKYEVKTDNIKR